MACPNAKSFLLLRRWYAVATENTRVRPVLASMKKPEDVNTEDLEGQQKKEKMFWMRDPKTGNWIPESHFDDVDVAELREKLLSRK